METSRFRVNKGRYGGQAEIFYAGNWISFGRTDFMDDVATSRCFDSMEALLGRVGKYIDWLKGGMYERAGWPGARISDKAFSVIDSYSDG